MQIQIFRLLLGSLIVVFFSPNLKAQDSAHSPLPGKWQIGNMIAIDDMNAFGHIEYGAAKAAMIVMDQKGQFLWNEPVKGYIKGEAKWNGNVIVFYSEKRSGGALHAAIVDIKEKKIVKDKIIYDIPTKPDGDIYIENDPSNNFNHLLFRSTSNNPLITLITLSADLEIYTKVLWIAKSKSFIGSHASKQGNIFITGISDNMLITEQFDREGELKNKLQIELDIRNKSYFTAISRPDTFTNNNILVAIQYLNADKDKAINLYNFDFDAEKVIRSTPVLLDRAYLDALDEKEPGAKKNLKPIDYLMPVDILTTQNKIMLVKEVRTQYTSGNNSNVSVLNTAAVVSVFNKKMQPLHENVLNKSYQAIPSWDSQLKCFSRNEKLYVFSSEGATGIFSDYCYIIDLTTGKKEKKKLPRVWGLLDPASTILFKNGCILGYVQKTINPFKKGETYLQSIKYEEIDKLVDVNQ